MGHINKKLLPLKLLLFFLYAAIGCLPAFLTIHMFHIGLSHEEVTWINAVLPLTALVGPPTVGYLADRFGHYRLITITAMFLAGVFHTALLFVPEKLPMYRPNLQMVCDTEGSSLVLQSCTGWCPQMPSHVHQGSFRVSNCRHECDIEGKHCGDVYLPEARVTANLSTEPVESEAELDGMDLPKLCLHSDNRGEIHCHYFDLPNFIELKTELEDNATSQKSMTELGEAGASQRVSPSFSSVFSRFDDCCEYPINSFATVSNVFSNLTCNPSPRCHVICNVLEMSNDSLLLQSPVCSVEDSNPKVTFWLYFCIRAIADMFPAILISLFDAVVLTMVAQHGGDYGRQKMFGLFAIGTSAPVVGYLMDGKIGVHGKYLFAPVFYVFDVLLLLTALITLLLPLKVEVQRRSVLKNLAELVRTREFNLLVLIVIILGSLNGYLETFLYIHLEKDLNASKFLLGLTITVGIVPSLPFLYKSDPIVSYCGHHYLLILAFVGYCIRFAGLSYLGDPLWVIPLEILELFTINLMQVTAATLTYKLAPKTLVATAQGIVWISHFGVGRALGTVIGGYLIKEYGMIRVFQGASVFSAIGATTYLTLYEVQKYASANRAREQRPQEAKENGVVYNGNYVPLPVMDRQC